jgi:hypothetical protein
MTENGCCHIYARMDIVKRFPAGEVLVLFVVWGVLLVFFFTLNTGITSTNDGSHFALISSLTQNGTAALGSSASLAAHDSAVYKGRRFADRNPGQAMIAYVFVKALTPFRSYFSPISMDPYYVSSGGSGGEILVAMVMLIPPLCGSLLFLVLYHVFRRFAVGSLLAMPASFVLILSSLTLRYSTVLYSHILATLLVAGAFLMFVLLYDTLSLRYLFWGHLLLASAVVVEHPTLVIYLAALAFLLLAARANFLTRRGIAAFVVSGAIPAIPFLTYNYVNFDNPFSIAHFHQASFDYFQNPLDIFSLHRFPLMAKQVLFLDRGFTSLFTSSPYYLLVPLAAIPFLRREIAWNAKYSLALAALVASIVPATTFSGDSGYDRDYRQMLFGLPFLMLFLVVFLDHVYSKSKGLSDPRSIVTTVIVLALAFRGWTAQFAHIRHNAQYVFDTSFMNTGAVLHNTLPIIVVGAIVAGWLAFQRRARANVVP